VSPAIRISLAAALLAAGARTLAAQATASPSPTLPSDTLQANYAPRSLPGPMPERAPTLPSDTLEATQPTDSLTTDSPPVDATPGEVFRRAPMSPGDSAALRDLRLWIERHPGLVAPPPTRAVLVRV
jgi:hypothetical protein